jgi:CRP/FNR family cyclic AMP-dependent transcriptional regulator
VSVADELKHFALLAEMNDEDRSYLADLLEPKSLVKGRMIFQEGTESEGLVLVVSGHLAIESRRGVETQSVEAPAALGALSLTSVGPRESSVRALSSCELLILPRTAYRRLVDDYPRTASRLLEAILADVSGLVRDSLEALTG